MSSFRPSVPKLGIRKYLPYHPIMVCFYRIGKSLIKLHPISFVKKFVTFWPVITVSATFRIGNNSAFFCT